MPPKPLSGRFSWINALGLPLMKLLAKNERLKRAFLTWERPSITETRAKLAALNGKIFINQTIELAKVANRDPFPLAGSPTFFLAPTGTNNSTQWLSDESVATFNTTKRGVFIYGTIWYDDIFKQSHWTQFCYEVISIEPSGIIGFQPCDRHNTSDDSN